MVSFEFFEIIDWGFFTSTFLIDFLLSFIMKDFLGYSRMFYVYP